MDDGKIIYENIILCHFILDTLLNVFLQIFEFYFSIFHITTDIDRQYGYFLIKSKFLLI